jgi:hypothetical protein
MRRQTDPGSTEWLQQIRPDQEGGVGGGFLDYPQPFSMSLNSQDRDTRLNWNPVLHPRSPRTGKFVEPPWDLPSIFDGVAGMTVSELVDNSSFNREIRRSPAWRASDSPTTEPPESIGDITGVGPTLTENLAENGFDSIEDVIRDPETARNVPGMGRIILEDSKLPTTREESVQLYPRGVR